MSLVLSQVLPSSYIASDLAAYWQLGELFMLLQSRVIIVRYILDEDAEDTEDADDDRSACHSRTTIFVEARK